MCFGEVCTPRSVMPSSSISSRISINSAVSVMDVLGKHIRIPSKCFLPASAFYSVGFQDWSLRPYSLASLFSKQLATGNEISPFQLPGCSTETVSTVETVLQEPNVDSIHSRLDLLHSHHRMQHLQHHRLDRPSVYDGCIGKIVSYERKF